MPLGFPNGSNGFVLVFHPSDPRPGLHIILLSFYIFRVAAFVKRRAETRAKPRKHQRCSHGGRVGFLAFFSHVVPCFSPLRFLSFDTFLDIFLSVRTRGSQKGRREERRRRNYNLISLLLSFFIYFGLGRVQFVLKCFYFHYLFDMGNMVDCFTG